MLGASPKHRPMRHGILSSSWPQVPSSTGVCEDSSERCGPLDGSSERNDCV